MCNRRMDKLFIVSVQGVLIPGVLYKAIAHSNEKEQATGSCNDMQEAHRHSDE